MTKTGKHPSAEKHKVTMRFGAYLLAIDTAAKTSNSRGIGA